jgi:hypothetical protein
VRILIFGAGVIGRIYAAQLLSAGHDVSILTRGAVTDELRTDGIHLVGEGVDDLQVFPRVVEALVDAGHTSLVFVAVRLDQVDTALVSLGALDADVVASFINLPLGTDRLRQMIGADRFVSAFPGVAGRLGRQGTVHYVQVTQQPTAVGQVPTSDWINAEEPSEGCNILPRPHLDRGDITNVLVEPLVGPFRPVPSTRRQRIRWYRVVGVVRADAIGDGVDGLPEGVVLGEWALPCPGAVGGDDRVPVDV